MDNALVREGILAWVDQFPSGHYEYDMYGQAYTVDLPRATVEAVLDIAILLVNRVVAAKGELHTAEYEALEESVRRENPKDGDWLFRSVMKAVADDHLFGRYKDIAPMIGRLHPRGYLMGTAAYLLMVLPELHKLIYVTIRLVDTAEENYNSLVYTVFLGFMAKGWGQGEGWSKEGGNWIWRNQ